MRRAFAMAIALGITTGALAATTAHAGTGEKATPGIASEAVPYASMIHATASRHGLPPHLVEAVIRAESNFDARAISPKGAMGLMQLMPGTAVMLGVRNPFDVKQNLEGGVRHLVDLLYRFSGNLRLALAAYNAGTRPVDAADGIPNIAETREYVRRVRAYHAIYKNGQPEKPGAPSKPPVVQAAAMRAPMMARLDLDGKTLDQIYGVPIVLKARAAH